MDVSERGTGDWKAYCKAYWKGKAFEWLRAKTGYCDFHFEDCLRNLERNPQCREAALAAFWNVYLGEEPRSLTQEQVETIKRIVNSTHPPDAPKEDIEAVAYVKLHLAGVLIVCLIRPGHPLRESPNAIHALEAAVAVAPLTPKCVVEDPESWGTEYVERDLFCFSDALVTGIAFVEAALWRKEQGLYYEEAFSLIDDGAQLMRLAAATVEDPNIEFRNGRVVPHSIVLPRYLPHSGKGFHIQEAADIFESLKTHYRDVKAWKRVQQICESFQHLGGVLYDWNETITDSEGNPWEAIEYWPKAVTFAELQMHPSDLVRAREEREQEEAETRLRRDFFGDLWQELESEVRQLLIETEIHFAKGHFRDMVMDFRPILEKELAAMFPFLETAKRGQDSHLVLTRMKNLLRSDLLTQASIRSLRLREEEPFILQEIPNCIEGVVNVRNYFEHAEGWPEGRSEMIKEAKKIRRELLGIGKKGILRRLAEIKRSIRHKRAL